MHNRTIYSAFKIPDKCGIYMYILPNSLGSIKTDYMIMSLSLFLSLVLNTYVVSVVYERLC